MSADVLAQNLELLGVLLWRCGRLYSEVHVRCTACLAVFSEQQATVSFSIDVKHSSVVQDDFNELI